MKKANDEYNQAAIQCALLTGSGCKVSFRTKKNILGDTPVIKIIHFEKHYHFSDPDWRVVNAQLAMLVEKFFVPLIG